MMFKFNNAFLRNFEAWLDFFSQNGIDWANFGDLVGCLLSKWIAMEVWLDVST